MGKLRLCFAFAATSAMAGGAPPPDEETWQYFAEIALQAEYQDIEPVVRKWTTPVVIRIFGEPRDADLLTLAATVRELRELSGNRLRFQFVADSGYYNLGIHFIPSSQFSQYAPLPSGQNIRGYFLLRWDEDYAISYGTILIATDEELITEQRTRLVREEFTQAMGLLNDSNRYPDSIFYRSWTENYSYSDLDRRLIRMLYAEGVAPGMDESALRALFKAQPPTGQN